MQEPDEAIATMNIKCRHCEKTEEDTHLNRCRACLQYFCDEHAAVRGGVMFCSDGCGTTFFDPDTEEDESWS